MNLKFSGHVVALGLLAGCAQTVQVSSRPAGGAIAAPQSSPALALGRDLYARQEYALAIAKFNEVVRDQPDKPDGYNALAASYDMIGRFDLSQRYYEQALARAPADGRIYRNMARSLRMQGREGEALAVLAEWDAASAAKGATPATSPSIKVAVGEHLQTEAPYDWKPVQASDEASAALKALPIETRSVVIPAPAGSPVQSTASVTISVPPSQYYAPGAARLEPRVAAQSSAQAAIRIMNAAGKRGLARGLQSWLAHSGWEQSRTGDLDRRFERSYIIFPRVSQAQAFALSRQLPFATGRIVDERATRVVLILGKNAAATNLPRNAAKASAG